MSNDDPIKALSDRVTRLECDIKVANKPLSECDFQIRKDPAKASASYQGRMVSEVDDDSYLWYLQNLLDWQASKDEAVVGDDEESKKKRKYAAYRRMDAAKVRRFKEASFHKNKNRGGGGGGGGGKGEIPF